MRTLRHKSDVIPGLIASTGSSQVGWSGYSFRGLSKADASVVGEFLDLRNEVEAQNII